MKIIQGPAQGVLLWGGDTAKTGHPNKNYDLTKEGE